MQNESIFIKIERYGEVLKNIDGAKKALNNIKEVLKALENLEKIKEKSTDALQKNLDTLDALIRNVNSYIPDIKKRGSSEPLEDRVIDEAILSLHDEIESLKRSLQESEVHTAAF
jgi:uncharacterized protein YPO0396